MSKQYLRILKLNAIIEIMPSEFIPVTGAELKRYRASTGTSLQEMADLLQVKSPSTLSAWENGQEIPGPAQLLLRMLIHGEVPFKGDTIPPNIRDAMWELEMSLETWEEINRRRLAGGYATVTDWIASLVREELHEQQNRGDFKTADQAPPEDVALSAEDTTPPPVTEPRQEVVYGETSKKKKL